MKGASEFKHTGNQYNIRTIFKTKYALKSLLMKAKLERDLQQVVSQNSPFNPMHWFSWTWFVARFLHEKSL
jgi:hypothetical protein